MKNPARAFSRRRERQLPPDHRTEPPVKRRRTLADDNIRVQSDAEAKATMQAVIEAADHAEVAPRSSSNGSSAKNSSQPAAANAVVVKLEESRSRARIENDGSSRVHCAAKEAQFQAQKRETQRAHGEYNSGIDRG